MTVQNVVSNLITFDINNTKTFYIECNKLCSGFNISTFYRKNIFIKRNLYQCHVTHEQYIDVRQAK